MNKIILLIAIVTLLFSLNAVVTAGNDGVTICHKPGTNAEHTLTVSTNAVDAHLAHGDYIGECSEGEPSPQPTPSFPPAVIPDGYEAGSRYSVRYCADLNEWGGYLWDVEVWVNGSKVEGALIPFDVYVTECLQFDAVFSYYVPLEDIYFTQPGGYIPLWGWYANNYGEALLRQPE